MRWVLDTGSILKHFQREQGSVFQRRAASCRKVRTLTHQTGERPHLLRSRSEPASIPSIPLCAAAVHTRRSGAPPRFQSGAAHSSVADSARAAVSSRSSEPAVARCRR